ncbi:hypothetical protein EDB19DRAFT_1833324 [Suillus lakei]|nr:hypothetical protein EDB19DRAFT_1833324 [Suillus lakei]
MSGIHYPRNCSEAEGISRSAIGLHSLLPMAGKKKTGGRNADNAGESSASPLHLDTRPIQAVKAENDVGQEMQKLDTQLAKCRAGVAWIDLLKMAKRLKFGVYNDRAENKTERNKLIASFQKAGIVSMRETSVIPIIVDMKRLRSGLTLSSDFTEPEKIRELDLVDRDEIVVASGQHRLSALQKYNQSLEDEYAALEKKWEKIASLKNVTTEHVTQWNEIREEMGVILGKLDNIGKWGVIVYNKTLLLAKGDVLASHLSRNSTLHEYKETEEEVLITIFRQMLAKFKDPEEEGDPNEQVTLCLHELKRTQEKNARLQKVLVNDSLCVLLATQLLRMGLHFRHRREFSVTWLAKSMDVCMGVFVAWINTRCTTLKRLASDEPFPDFKTVEKLLDDVEQGDEEAQKQVKKLRETIEGYAEEEEGDISIWGEVLEKVDSQKSLGRMTPEYVMQLSTYREGVLAVLRKTWLGGNAGRGKDNMIIRRLDSVMARVLLVLTPDVNADTAPEPLLGGMMLDYAWDYFQTVKIGIAEICRWFEALLDSWKLLHPKVHTMDDWSTVMLNNIKNDPRFRDVDVRPEITNIIWQYRDSLVMRLNNQMTKVNRRLPARPKDRKAFDIMAAALPDSQKISSNALEQLVGSRRRATTPHAKTRSMMGETLKVTGMMALHVTSWDWLHSSLKNGNRDILPCINAITMENMYMQKYRPELLRDGPIGALRRLLEVYVNGKLVTGKVWKWWDDILLDASQHDTTKVMQSIKNKFTVNQHQTQEKLALETVDRDIITKTVNSITNLALLKVTGSSHSDLSTDITRPLALLVAGMQLNSSRLRLRHLCKDNEAMFDVETQVEDLQIQLIEGVEDEYTTGYPDESLALEKLSEPATVPQEKSKGKGKAKAKAKGKGKQKAASIPSNDEASSPSPELSIPALLYRSRVPFHANHSQPSPTLVPDSSDNDEDTAGPSANPPQGKTNTDNSTKESAGDLGASQPPVVVSDKDVDHTPSEAVASPIIPTSSDGLSQAIDDNSTAPNADPTPRSTPCYQLRLRTQGIAFMRFNHSRVSTPVAAVATVATASPIGTQDFSSNTLPPLTPSPSDAGGPGWGTGDTQWFEDEARGVDADTDPREMDDDDDPRDATYVPTQESAQNSSPPQMMHTLRSERPVDVLPPPAAQASLSRAQTDTSSQAGPSTAYKRSRAATGASSASSTSGRGKKQKKKAKTASSYRPGVDPDDELTIIPTV